MDNFDEVQEEYKWPNEFDSDVYDSEDEDEDINYRKKMEKRFIKEINRMIYLGPLYKKCDSHRVGVTDKELKNRLEYLKKTNRVPKDCNVSEFINICKLHTEPHEADTCYVNFKQMVKNFQVDSIKSFMMNGRLNNDMLAFLLIYFPNELNLSIDILIYAIYLYDSYTPNTVKLLLQVLKSKGIYTKEYFEYVHYNKVFAFTVPIKIVTSEYNAELVKDLLEYLNIVLILNILVHVPSRKLENYKYFKTIMDHVDYHELSDYNYVHDVMLDIMHDELPIIGKYTMRQIYNNFKQYDSKMMDEVNHRLKESVELYQIENLEVVDLLAQLNILDPNFDMEEYQEELMIRMIQREQGIDTLNVHSTSTNNINNKIIKTLIPNPNKERDVLNLEFTTKSAREFIETLNDVNLTRTANGKQPLNVNVEDVLRCQNYFYDYNDRLTGRDRTPPGEGIEVCNVFVKIWDLAKEQLSNDQLRDYTERLGEEFESILQKDIQGVANPVCSTGWATRLVNSIIGTAIDIGVVPAPDIKVIVQELNNFIARKRADLDDSKSEKDAEEAEAFDDSIAMISDDNFEVAKAFINRRLNEFVNKIYNEYKFTGIRKKQVRDLANEAKEKLFTV